ncbi:MAG: hypothetical protein JHC26_03135 [Thermofilum sp.]|jgi:hypothetical protein|uniref:hypothetical protein n=1 Tax=Thermofilum sp. TaxID=1961369 RepID=UPI0025853F7C|nr:hypothetical protein [Thermofilum sp.]MCI4408062.1 hypothetical protein [Thermofilum sp.]
MDNVGRDVKNLIKKLLKQNSNYFSNGSLNSEGRKIFEEMARMLVYEKPYLKKRIREIRKKGTFEDVLKLAEDILPQEELIKIARGWYAGPYTESPDIDDFLLNSYLFSPVDRSTGRMPSSSK